MQTYNNKQIEEIIKKAAEGNSTAYYGIGGFTPPELDRLAEYAKQYGVVIMLEFEHNNFHQGAVLVICSKDAAIDYLKW